MKSVFGKILSWLLEGGQLKEDLTKVVLLVAMIAQTIEDTMKDSAGAVKRKKAIDEFFDSAEKEGGIELPSFLEGNTGRVIVGLIVDFVVSVANGDRPN